MFIYNDYSYVEYVFNLPYVDGFELYLKCLSRLNNINKNREEDKLFKLYLFDVQHGNFEGSFDDYNDKMRIKAEDRQMSNEDKEKEENRIQKETASLAEEGRNLNGHKKT